MKPRTTATLIGVGTVLAAVVFSAVRQDNGLVPAANSQKATPAESPLELLPAQPPITTQLTPHAPTETDTREHINQSEAITENRPEEETQQNDPDASPESTPLNNDTSVGPTTTEARTDRVTTDPSSGDDPEPPPTSLPGSAPNVLPNNPAATTPEIEPQPAPESPPPISVVVPPSTTTTIAAATQPTVSCTVAVNVLDTTQPTPPADRKILVEVDVDSSDPLPAVWTEVQWENQVRRAVVQLNPFGAGQILLAAPGVGPPSAKIFITSEFAAIHQRCVS